MGRKGKDNTRMTTRRVLSLLLSFILLCVAGGVTISGFYAPALIGLTKTVNSSGFSLQGESVDLDLTKLPQQSRMYSSGGKLIAQFYTQNRIVVALKNISPWMQKAMVAREDHDFLQESGIDPRGIARAFVQTFVRHGSTQGGSTLTQQYVKNALIDQAMEENDPIAAYHARADTITRKLREMLIAQELDKHYNKAEILQGYLNIAQYGVNVYGVEIAAEHYFSVPAKDLTLGEAATIAAITKNPDGYDPTKHPQVAEQQRNTVLQQMVKYGFATQAQASAAEAVPMAQSLRVTNFPMGCEAAGIMGYACDYTVRDILLNPEFGKTVNDRRRLLYQGGLKIYTTFSESAEQEAYNVLTAAVPATDPSGVVNAMASVQPGTGKIIEIQQNKLYNVDGDLGSQYTAMDYSVDEAEGGGTGFGIGSAFKPINLVAWLQTGHNLSTELPVYTVYPVDSFPDAKKTGAMWSVQNEGDGTVSPESPLHAFIWSHNPTQAAMEQIIGEDAIGKAATELGYHNASIDNSNIMDTLTPTMVIGTLDVSPLTMANVYATIAASGVECTPIAIDKVINAAGQSITVPPANCHQAVSKDIAHTVAYAMYLYISKGQLGDVLKIPGYRAFGKTGTNQNASLADGIFLPQMSTFIIGAQPQHPSWLPRCINGVCQTQWWGEQFTAKAIADYVSDYAHTMNWPNNDYGQPDPNMVNLPLTPNQWEYLPNNVKGNVVAPMTPTVK